MKTLATGQLRKEKIPRQVTGDGGKGIDLRGAHFQELSLLTDNGYSLLGAFGGVCAIRRKNRREVLKAVHSLWTRETLIAPYQNS